MALGLWLSVSHGIGGNFSLTTHTGEAFTLDDIRGKVGILFFGFTHCPDVCPTTLLEIQRLMVQLKEQSSEVKVLFVSVDPDRDTVEKLDSYVTFFNKDFIGLTGTIEEIRQVSEQYNSSFRYIPNESKPGDYAVEHSANLFLIDKTGQLAGIILPRTPYPVLEQQVRKLLDH